MNTLNRKKSIGLYSLLVLAAFLLMSSYAYGSPDYYNYWTWNTGYSTAYGVDGWVGGDGISRIIFYDSFTNDAHIYQVTTDAHPNLHPDNPDATGPIATRTFTHESSFALNSSNYGHECEFHVGSSTFYLGAKNGIEMYAFDGTYLGNLGAPAPPTEGGYSTQSLAYDAPNNDWWAGSIGFDGWVEMYSYDADNVGSAWQLEFSYVTPGYHHDGLEMLPNGNLLTADYTGEILEYQQDGTYVATHSHLPFPTELEGMGSGALGHYWGGSHSGLIFEFGGGSLPPPDVIPVTIDIKPGSFPSSINLQSKGVTPVAIHTTSIGDGESQDFDATTVDPTTVLLNYLVAPLMWEIYDCDEIPNPLYGEPGEPEMIGDGDVDLVLYFDIQELGTTGAVEVGDEWAILTGETTDGVPIEGIGDVSIIGPKKK